jgi:hypothetical protein
MILAFKSFAAQLTGKSSFVAVRQFVFGQGRRAGKDFTTHLRKKKNKNRLKLFPNLLFALLVRILIIDRFLNV